PSTSGPVCPLPGHQQPGPAALRPPGRRDGGAGRVAEGGGLMRCAGLVPPPQQAAELACLGEVGDGGRTQPLSGPLDGVVPWGATEPAEVRGGVAFRLNRPEALALAADPIVSRRLWRLSGLKVRWSLPRYGYYRVCIAHL